MDTISRVYVQTASLSGMPNRHELREGDVVSVRILSQTGQNSYIASFAGGRFSVTSERPFVQGALFSASVSLKDGTLVLSPLMDDAPFSNEHLVTTFSTALNPDGTLSDAELVRYFTSLNLPPDSVTAALFAAMQSLGMKFDERIFNDARRIALAFPRREKEAAEAALLLEQKGIPMGKDAVAAIVGENEKSDKDSEGDAASQSGARAEKGEADGKRGIDTDRPLKALVSEVEAEVRRFFCGMLSGKRAANGAVQGKTATIDTEASDAAYDVRAERALEQRESGVLTLFNHRGFSSGAGWIQIPFEISFDGGAKTGSGVLRFFTDVRQKKAEKCTVTLDFGGQFYYFVIYLQKGRVLYAVQGTDSADESAALEKALEAAFGGKSFSVERSDGSALSGFYEKSRISVVRGSV
ncbi:hypothetical protein [Treponema sp. Marseille-Q4130]|uniref:hypothetical protein n=1 Tax=Treponema sp. Marseille-Q4130 TaxID=2766702 RepID=UPI00165212F8|nr:hypothetical protein [Treponema sp. Marseille-Q4130]MBC6720497.1 hypothetical protein [Treponema sp. Marseille-Q4130]